MASKFPRRTSCFALSQQLLPLRPPQQRTVTAAAAPGEVSTASAFLFVASKEEGGANQRQRGYGRGLLRSRARPFRSNKRKKLDGKKTTAKPLELHVGPTTLSLPFNQQRAAELKAALALLLATFAEKAKAERPKRWQALEYKFRNGDGDDGGATPPGLALFEVFCNPNAAASPFDAKVLVTVKSTEGGVGFTTEAPLSALRADLDAY